MQEAVSCEALTQDELFDRIQIAEEEKSEKKSKRTGQKGKNKTCGKSAASTVMEEQSDEDTCQGCSKNYDDDAPEAGWLAWV